MSERKSARKSADVVPKHGRGKLLAGGQWGNPGGGRPPDEFKRICQSLASRDETLSAVAAILEDPTHPAYLGALKWASEHGYGRPAQPVEHSGSVSIEHKLLERAQRARGDHG